MAAGEKVRKMRTSEDNGTIAGASGNDVGVDREGVVESGGTNKGILEGAKFAVCELLSAAKQRSEGPIRPV